MKLEGGCYCRQVRYIAEGEPRLRADCSAANASMVTGGGPNLFMLMPPEGFRYYERRAEDLHPQRPRSAGHARILRDLRHAPHKPPARVCPFVILKIGTLGRPSALQRSANGDPHRRQATLPRPSRRPAGVRAPAAALGDAPKLLNQQPATVIARSDPKVEEPGGTKQSMPPPRPAAWIASPSARNDDGFGFRRRIGAALQSSLKDVHPATEPAQAVASNFCIKWRQINISLPKSEGGVSLIPMPRSDLAMSTAMIHERARPFPPGEAFHRGRPSDRRRPALCDACSRERAARKIKLAPGRL